MLQGLLKSCVIIAFLVLFFYGQRVILCLIAPKWQIRPVMLWWKCEIIKLLRRPAACVYSLTFFPLLQMYATRASRGQAVIYTNSLPQPFLDSGVITWEQNGFISFNLVGAAICTGNICCRGVCTVKQLETGKESCLQQRKKGRGGSDHNKNQCKRQYCRKSEKSMLLDEMRHEVQQIHLWTTTKAISNFFLNIILTIFFQILLFT